MVYSRTHWRTLGLEARGTWRAGRFRHRLRGALRQVLQRSLLASLHLCCRVWGSSGDLLLSSGEVVPSTVLVRTKASGTGPTTQVPAQDRANGAAVLGPARAGAVGRGGGSAETVCPTAITESVFVESSSSVRGANANKVVANLCNGGEKACSDGEPRDGLGDVSVATVVARYGPKDRDGSDAERVERPTPHELLDDESMPQTHVRHESVPSVAHPPATTTSPTSTSPDALHTTIHPRLQTPPQRPRLRDPLWMSTPTKRNLCQRCTIHSTYPLMAPFRPLLLSSIISNVEES